MSYPTRETVELFCEVLKKDGMEDVMEKLLMENGKDLRMMPILSFFKQSLTQLMEDHLLDEIDGYSSGFLCCLDLFRRQIGAEEVTLDDLNIQIDNMIGWSQYLENESLTIRNELNELTRKYKELQKLYSERTNGNLPGTS